MMKRLWFFTLLLFGLSACGTAATSEPEADKPEPVPVSTSIPTSTPIPTVASFPNLGPAPELTNDVWLNVDAPLRLADLRGKVVAIEMWTFG